MRLSTVKNKLQDKDKYIAEEEKAFTWIRDSTRRRIRVCINPSEHWEIFRGKFNDKQVKNVELSRALNNNNIKKNKLLRLNFVQNLIL